MSCPKHYRISKYKINIIMAKKDFNAEELLMSFSSRRETTFQSTGVQDLDGILGGGIDLKGFYSFWGEAGCGKTTIALQIAREFLKSGKRVLFCDTEHSFNTLQEQSMGLSEYIENEQLVVVDPDVADKIEQVINLVVPNKFDLFILDSVSAMIPYLGDNELSVMDKTPGTKARQSKTIMSKAKSIFSQNNVASIWIFHAAANIVTGYGQYATTATKQDGGYATYHIPDVRVYFSPGAVVKEGDVPIGCVCKIVCEKNKYCPPKQRIEKKLIYGKGIDLRYDFIDAAIAGGFIQQKGGYFEMPWGLKIKGIKNVYNMDDESYNKLVEAVTTGDTQAVTSTEE